MTLTKILLKRVDDEVDVIGRKRKQWSVFIGSELCEETIGEDMKLVIDTLNLLIDKVSK